eukprot:1161049-Pelagomonas_calceolata.AAC.4
MRSHARKLHKAVVSGKYNFVFPQEAQKKFENSIPLKKGPRGHDKSDHVMLCTSILSIHCYRCIAMLQERILSRDRHSDEGRHMFPSMVAMRFDLQPGSLAAQPAQLFQPHNKYP